MDFMLVTAIVFIFILSVLVLIHEAGHFFVARKLGIKVEEFGFGFPILPKIFAIKRGETIYSIYPALIGGFVKLYGEDEAGAGRIKLKTKNEKLKTSDEKRAFYSRSVKQRATVVVAGVVMNALLAFVIYYIYLSVSGFSTYLPLFGSYKFLFANQVVVNNEKNSKDNIIAMVSDTSPLKKAGMKPPVRLTNVDNKPVNDVQSFIKYIDKRKGKSVQIAWQDITAKNNAFAVTADHTASVVPRVKPPANEGPLGIYFVPMIFVSYDTIPQQLLSGITYPVNLMVYQFEVLGQFIDISIKRNNIEPLGQAVQGPVGIFSYVGAVVGIPEVKERILQLLNLSGLFSISLAFMNLLPIPGLDGGRLFLIILEGVFGLKLKPQTEGLINAIGMALLLLLMVLITYKDILQLIK